MGISGSLATDLAVLTRAVDDPEIDLEALLHAFTTAARLTIASYLGMTMTVAVDGHEVSVTVDDHDTTPIAASLVIPLTAVSSAEAGSTLTLYAGRPGAFVDLAADLSYALGVDHTDLVLDDHLAPTGSAVTGLDRHLAINRAIGILLERGHTPESARELLHRLDPGNLHVTAEQLLHSPELDPDSER